MVCIIINLTYNLFILKKYTTIISVLFLTFSAFAIDEFHLKNNDNFFTDDGYVSDNRTPNKNQSSSKYFNLGKSLLAGNTDSLKGTAINALTAEGIGVSKSFLEKYFPTVEISANFGDPSKPTAGILVVAPLSDINDVQNTFFTQLSSFYTDNRTTINIGFGYRRLEFDNKLLLGANVFYDHEFPYDHQRTSVGLEARTTVGEVNFNQYWGISGWKDGRNGLEERALGGTDIEVGIPLPYMNWAKFYARSFVWNAVDGVNDIKGNDVSLQARMNGFIIEAGHRTYNTLSDEDFIRVSYNLNADKSDDDFQWFSETAYKLASMEKHRFDKVRRENLIVKQRRGALRVITR